MTRTHRSPREVVPPRAADSDPIRVTIVEGETLCLRGRLVDDGTEAIVGLDLRIGDAISPKDLPLIMLWLDPPGPQRQLHVRTLGGTLSFDIGTVDDTGAEHPFGRLRTRPGGADFPASETVHELSLDGPRFEERPTGPRIDQRSAGGNVALAAGAHLFRSLRGFDDALRASGYTPFARIAPVWGLALHVEFRRWRLHALIGDVFTRADGPSGQIHADVLEAHVAAGYDFLRWRGLSGFALFGIDGDMFRMDAVAPNWNYLGSQAGALGDPDSISRDVGTFTIETGFQQFVPFRPIQPSGGAGMVASMQLGYAQQFALGSWTATGGGNGSVAGTHDMNLSGMWILLGVGVGYVE